MEHRVTTWNYRVVSVLSPDGEDPTFDIREVYYEDGVPVRCSPEPVEIRGATVAELRSVYWQLSEAFWQPSLCYPEDFFLDPGDRLRADVGAGKPWREILKLTEAGPVAGR